MKTELLYKSPIEKLAENTYVIEGSSTIQLHYGFGFGNVGPVGSPFLRKRFRVGSVFGYDSLNSLDRMDRYNSTHIGSTPKNSIGLPSFNSSYIGSTPKSSIQGTHEYSISRESISKIEPMKKTEIFTTNLDDILKGLREINKFHPAKPEPLHDQLFGIKGEHGKVLEFIRNNKPVVDPFKILREYLDKPKL